MSAVVKVASLGLAMLATACKAPPTLVVDVVRHAPARSLRVAISERRLTGEERRIELISIATAPAARHGESAPRHFWLAAHVEGQPYLQPPVSVGYGERIPGYAVSAAPALPVGEYQVRAIVSGEVASSRFRITAQNRVE